MAPRALLLAALAIALSAPLASAAPSARASDISRALAPLRDTPPAPLSCATCETVVSVIQQLAENATTAAAFVALFEEACTIIDLPALTPVCDAFFGGLAELGTAALEWLDKQIRTIAWDIPLNVCATVIPVCEIPCCDAPTAPEQLRLAPAAAAGALSITWITLNATAAPAVQWGPAGGPMAANASAVAHTYSHGGWVGVIYAATMTGLAPGTAYSYVVGDAAGGWSAPTTFTTLPANVGTAARPLRIVNLGDMDWLANDTIARVTALVDAGSVDMVVHQGEERAWPACAGGPPGSLYHPPRSCLRTEQATSRTRTGPSSTGTSMAVRSRPSPRVCPTSLSLVTCVCAALARAGSHAGRDCAS